MILSVYIYIYPPPPDLTLSNISSYAFLILVKAVADKAKGMTTDRFLFLVFPGLCVRIKAK